MAGGVEAAAIIFSIFVVLRLGIRVNLVVYMYVAGIACLLVNFVPEGNHTYLITLVLIGKRPKFSNGIRLKLPPKQGH